MRPSRRLQDLPPHTKEWDKPSPRGEKLAMFMSAREITSTHQALDGDREEHFIDDNWSDGYDPRAGMLTNRSQNTQGEANVAVSDIPSYGGPKKVWGQSEGGNHRPLDPSGFSHQRPVSRLESDPQVWSRKYNEANMDEEDYREARGEEYHPKFQRADGGLSDDDVSWTHLSAQFDSKGSMIDDSRTTVRRYRDPVGGGSLRDAIIHGGGVHSPINLMETKGELGKPQVAGGHHRVAVMLNERPDELMPVLHNEDFGQARANRHYRYT